MDKWLESVYSDGSPLFVSATSLSLGEEVAIRIRIYDDAPVEHVFLRTVPNGAERLTEALVVENRNGLNYYEAKIKMNEYRIHYQFYVVTKDTIYYYTQNGITTYIPDHTYDFVLLSDYVQPDWVKRSVFYQIFPERFCNGNPEISVKDNEYSKDGYYTKSIKDWNATPLQYEEGRALDFYGGDLIGIKQKIPYLKKLGVTAVYINPIFCAPTTHKYDCSDYYHVDPHFGGDEALADLTKALHEEGMRVILDISINHTGTSHVWFKKAMEDKNSVEREFYFFKEGTDEYLGWFDNKDLPVLNYNSKELRRRIYEDKDSVLRKWLQPPYSIDGWRFDVADVFARNDEHQLSREIWPKIREAIREENPKALVLAEDWGDCGTYMQGKEWDSTMNYFGFGRIIRQYLGTGDLFVIRNSILKDIPYKMTAEDVMHRVMEHLTKIPFAMWENQFNLYDSHDVPRLRHENVTMKEWRFATIFQFMMIGTPSVYYGGETNIIGWVESDAGFRAPMPWDSDFEKDEPYQLIETLAHRKTEYPSLYEGGMKFLYAADDVIALARMAKNDVHVMLSNHSNEDKEVVIPLGAVGITDTHHLTEVFGASVNMKWVSEREVCVCIPAMETLLLFASE